MEPLSKPKELPRCIIFAAETGGLSAVEHSLLVLAAVVWENNKIIDEIKILVKEDEIIVTDRAMEINGIDLSHLHEHGLSPSGCAGNLLDFMSLNDVTQCAGHNAKFDLKFIARLFREAGRPLPVWFDPAAALDTAAIPVPGGKSLKAALIHYDVTPEPKRSALNTAKTKARLLTAINKAGDANFF